MHLQVSDDKRGQKIFCEYCNQKILVASSNKRSADKTVLVEKPRVLSACEPTDRVSKKGHIYYVYQEAEKGNLGPVSKSQLKSMAGNNQLRPESQVWIASYKKWVLAKHLQGFPWKENGPPPRPSKMSHSRIIFGGFVAACLIAAVFLLSYPLSFKQTRVEAANISSITTTAPTVNTLAPKKVALDVPKKNAPVTKPNPVQPLNVVTKKPKEFTEVVAEVEKSVALIEVSLGQSKSTGTGFVIGPNLMATNAHVIEKGPIRNLKVYFPSEPNLAKKAFPVRRVVHFDKRVDLALIEVITDQPPLPLRTSSPSKGKSVFTVGNPGLGNGVLIMKNALSKGYVSSVLSLPNQGLALQLNLSVNPGNSGGPLLTDDGKVVGVIKSKASKQEGVSFAVRLTELREATRNAKTLSAAEKESRSAHFEARVAFVRMMNSAKVHLLGTDYNRQVWNRTHKNGQTNLNPIHIRNPWKKIVKKGVTLSRYQYVDDLAPILRKLNVNQYLSKQIKNQLGKLSQVHMVLRNDAHNPSGNFTVYSNRCDENKMTLMNIENSLCPLLGVSSGEIIHPVLPALPTQSQQMGLNTKKIVLSEAHQLLFGKRHLYPIKLKANTTYKIDLQSRDFDAVVSVTQLNNVKKVYAGDDNSGDGFNSRLLFRPQVSQDYHIVVATYDGTGGDYQLIVEEWR